MNVSTRTVVRASAAAAAASGGLRRILVVVIACMTGVLALVVTATPANAVTVTSGVNLRACVNLSNPVCANSLGTTGTGGMQKMRCWRDGSSATGNYTSNRWFLIVLNDGREGYVHSSFVDQQQAVPNCTTLTFVRAADFAISLVGQTYATSTVAGDYAGTDWAPGPYGEWSGDCAKLTGSSFTRGAGVPYSRGNAIDQYYTYRNAGKISGGIPRYGDPVFYNIAAPYGHTAIYIGGTSIISTQGMDFAKQPVAVRGLYSYANYLGWAVL